MAEIDENEKGATTSFVPKKATKLALKSLRADGWNLTEIVNAGILMFSQAEPEQQHLFRGIAYGYGTKSSIEVKEIIYKWVIKVIADAQIHILKSRPEEELPHQMVRLFQLLQQPMRASQEIPKAKPRTKRQKRSESV